MSDSIESIYWTLLGIAGTKERNFLIDDYNNSPEGRKMVLKNFPGLKKKVVVFLPPLEEIQQRFSKSTEKRITEEKFNQMLASFSIPRKIGLTFSDIQYIDTKVPEDIVNEYRSVSKQNTSASPIKPLSKSTELLPVSASAHPSITSQPSLSSSLPLYTNPNSASHSGTHPVIHPGPHSVTHSVTHSGAHSATHSATHSSTHSGTHPGTHSVTHSGSHPAPAYYGQYPRKNEPVHLPLRTLPNFPERQFLKQQIRVPHHPYPHPAYHGMKLSRSDYYIPSKYDYQRMPYIVYPNQYAPYN